jgi:hypothetical protein
MRRFLLISIPITFTLAVIVSSLMAYLAYAAPFQPGSACSHCRSSLKSGRPGFSHATGLSIARAGRAAVLDLLNWLHDREWRLSGPGPCLDQAEIAGRLSSRGSSGWIAWQSW